MKNYLFFLFILSLLIIFSKCANDDVDDDENDISEEGLANNSGEDEYGFFKETLKSYLVANDLFDSDREIEPQELRSIFLDVISEGDPDSSPPHLRRIFEQMADHFVEKYYNDKKQIKGKDLYELFDINEIYSRFGEIVAETPWFDDYNEELDDLDNRDSIIDDL